MRVSCNVSCKVAGHLLLLHCDANTMQVVGEEEVAAGSENAVAVSGSDGKSQPSEEKLRSDAPNELVEVSLDVL